MKQKTSKINTDDYKWALLNAAEQLYDLSINILASVPDKTKAFDKQDVKKKLEHWNKLLGYYHNLLKAAPYARI